MFSSGYTGSKKTAKHISATSN